MTAHLTKAGLDAVAKSMMDNNSAPSYAYPSYEVATFPLVKPVSFMHHGNADYVNELVKATSSGTEGLVSAVATLIQQTAESGAALGIGPTAVNIAISAGTAAFKQAANAYLIDTAKASTGVGPNVATNTSDLFASLEEIVYCAGIHVPTATKPPSHEAKWLQAVAQPKKIGVGGGEVIATLTRHFNGLDEPAYDAESWRCPAAAKLPTALSDYGTIEPCNVHAGDYGAKSPTVAKFVQHLNDVHRWTYEEIADWLETLDVDITRKETPDPEPPPNKYAGVAKYFVTQDDESAPVSDKVWKQGVKKSEMFTDMYSANLLSKESLFKQLKFPEPNEKDDE